MLKAYKYRIYPNNKQKTLLLKHFGCVRFIYNQALDHKSKIYKEKGKSPSYFDLTTGWLKSKKDEFDWLKEVTAQSLQMSLRNLDNAYTNFFKKRAKFPKFKRKSNQQSCHFPQNTSVDFTKGKIRLPKMGWINCIFDRTFEGNIKTVTASMCPSGKFYVSILVETSESPKKAKKPNFKRSIGLDLGVASFVTTSSGEKFEAPKLLKLYLKKLANLQFKFSKKQKGNKNREKLRIKIARLHEKISNIRKDFLHKLSTKLVRENQTICLEDLKVQNMMEKGFTNLSRSLADVSISEFVNMLTYKGEWYGTNILFCGQFDPSTKLCSKCGRVQELALSERSWICNDCKTKHDRDINAAINIKNLAFGRGPSIKSVKQIA